MDRKKISLNYIKYWCFKETYKHGIVHKDIYRKVPNTEIERISVIIILIVINFSRRKLQWELLYLNTFATPQNKR